MKSFKEMRLQRAAARAGKLVSAVALAALTVIGGMSTANADD